MDEEKDDLGYMYYEAIMLIYGGDSADLRKAAELLEKAGSMGHAPAKGAAGLMYLDGRGVEQDYAKAYSLISEAAASLDPLSMYALGRMYEGGLGVEQSDREALYLFAFASEMGIPEAGEDADRVANRIAERRNRKLSSRPILNLEISDLDIEAACCREMFDSAVRGEIEVVDTYKGPELVRESGEGPETICAECPFCGKPVKKVSKNKIY